MGSRGSSNAVLDKPSSQASVPFQIETQQLNFYYPGNAQALFDISIQLQPKTVTALIGPSGCGKSTFLKTLNRMNDLIDGCRLEGHVLIHNTDIYDKSVNVVALRKEVGMVFQKSNPFPKSIYDNVAYGPRLHGENNKQALDEIVERCLQQAGLWDEVKKRLKDSAMALSGGQQQRLCIARTLAVNPKIILMDEPTSALDPASTQRVEELVRELGKDYTIIIVTHNMQQAKRISDHTAFFYKGRLVEFGTTDQIFNFPRQQATSDYVNGHFG